MEQIPAHTPGTDAETAPRAASQATPAPLLDVRGLTTVFHTAKGDVTAVDDVSFSLRPGRTLGLVGESGCGKSVTALSIMRLLPHPAGETTRGEVLFNGKNLLALPEKDMRTVRGNDISMIFQEPMTSLNPVFRVGDQVAEVIRLHKRLGRKEAWKEAVDLLQQVGIPSPEQRAREFPHQMSGGMRQRVMIAIALACTPRLIIADEPTTALDVTIQGQILDLMNTLSRETGSALLLITHDLGVVAESAEDVIVMYAGRIVEQSPVADLFANPLHPYTQGLLRSIPALPSPARQPGGLPCGKHQNTTGHGTNQAPEDEATPRPEHEAEHGSTLACAPGSARRTPLQTIPGTVPPLHALPAGCKFSDRCDRAFAPCATGEPPLFYPVPGHGVRCWLHA
ncbi:ABC transporter ATP-binding protein [Desulfovibrio psychrotolerans]|uniref:Dipeptide/oligopeptide/nickel ABC transporter ATP-binding protein n=1 Tax=Desulfovibrio psychrotolerans TaxID=415242 RepID=A0A7J0BSH0_9BACT|nr:ABC transporter ATP-binding protein [Desulfovibrio psychrotolerans]GFM36151.1 dipeptide/oligopeptide/nickel ABC transporter ATP-binding protein [Desulfovibrio psychrotolerans]